MGECQSQPERNTFVCVKCNEEVVEADNFCLNPSCEICPMCDYCSTVFRHNSFSDLKNFRWLNGEFLMSINRDLNTYKNPKLFEISEKIKKLCEIWLKEVLVSPQKKKEWLEKLRSAIQEYLMIPKSMMPTAKNSSCNLKSKASKEMLENIEAEKLKLLKKKSSNKIMDLDKSPPKRKKSKKKYEFEGVYQDNKVNYKAEEK